MTYGNASRLGRSATRLAGRDWLDLASNGSIWLPVAMG